MSILSWSTYANTEHMPFAETLILLLSEPCDVSHLAHTGSAKVQDSLLETIGEIPDDRGLNSYVKGVIVHFKHLHKRLCALFSWTLCYILAH